MAQHSHVPEFGNWENDNIPYTAYFENARKERGGVMINPNDPEENPEAFMYMGSGGLEMTAHDYRAVQAPNHLRVDSSTKSVSPEEKQHIDKGHTSHRSHRRINPSDLQKNGNPRIIEFESGSSYRSSKSDYSLIQQPSHRRKRSDNKKTPAADGVDSFSSTVPGHGRQRVGSYSSVEIVNDVQHRRGASSIPKFGAWNEADPKSGEGFTVIFNRLKERKQTETSHFPVVQQQQQPSYHSNTERHERSSLDQRFFFINDHHHHNLQICCCLFSSRSE
ncbi:RPM1-interacting protein 4-like [Juglans microcarpa x Juglans regia]|uniref:RPM1-interacting protein 4-like n=1 Tax=Juglans microcarpa x Juglans regia TaxID=2249226 RepID=UPI001B7DE666|nr:RPM1-interacting protein 4-like [Juglans microcarpa x Juglans regia]